MNLHRLYYINAKNFKPLYHIEIGTRIIWTLTDFIHDTQNEKVESFDHKNAARKVIGISKNSILK